MTNPGALASDEELVAAYRRAPGRDLLDELVRRYLGRLRGVVLPMVLDDAVADDLTQEAFLRALRHLDQFDGRSKFSTWLVRVAMNTTHSYLAKRGRSRVEFRDVVPEPRRGGPPADAAVLGAELRGEIEAALAELSPRLRAAIVLTTYERLGPGEAAKVEGCTAATMYWRLHQARKQLRRRLGQYLQ